MRKVDVALLRGLCEFVDDVLAADVAVGGFSALLHLVSGCLPEECTLLCCIGGFWESMQKKNN